MYKNSISPPSTMIFHVSTYRLKYELLGLGASMEVWNSSRVNKERWHEKAYELMHEVGRLTSFYMKVIKKTRKIKAAQKRSFGVNDEVVVTILEELGRN